MGAVGLVVNPHAGRDVRRITSLARTVGGHDRVNTTARVLAGLAAAEVGEVVYMSEPQGTVEAAAATLGALHGQTVPRLTQVAVPGGGEATDAAGTTAAAAALGDRGVACVVVVGGDGTSRAVFRGWPEAVLVPVAGGTNNAVATAIEPGSVGLAAGRFGHGPATLAAHVHRRPCLRVAGEHVPADVALVDVAVTDLSWVGAHAVWQPGAIDEVVLARADPAVPGLVGLGGMVAVVGDDEGLHLRLGDGGRAVTAPLGPGQFARVGVTGCTVLPVGAQVVVAPRAGRRTLAYDGERDAVLPAGATATVTLAADGPRVLDVPALLRATVAGC